VLLAEFAGVLGGQTDLDAILTLVAKRARGIAGRPTSWAFVRHSPRMERVITAVLPRLRCGIARMTGALVPATISNMTMTAIARSVAGGLRNEVDVNGRHVIVTDEPETLGGTDEGPAPHELLPAMLASCVSTMISLHAQTRGWELGDTRVEVEYDADAAPRRVRVRVYLPDSLTPDQVRRLRNVADSCPARRALEAGFTFDEQVIVGTFPHPQQTAEPVIRAT
jgi:putative redox protein